MLHISFAELARGAEEKLFTNQARFSMDQRHRILQLVAETESTA